MTAKLNGVDGPLVGLIMGSDSDWPTMQPAAEALAEFGVPFEVGVVSAHRTPERMLDYAKSAAGRGLKVIIAGAGGAAHLPGMVASATPLPVIGVPLMKLKRKNHLLIACIVRRGRVIFPRGQDAIEAGDTVIIVTTHTGFRDISDILA